MALMGSAIKGQGAGEYWAFRRSDVFRRRAGLSARCVSKCGALGSAALSSVYSVLVNGHLTAGPGGWDSMARSEDRTQREQRLEKGRHGDDEHSSPRGVAIRATEHDGRL